MSKYAQDGFALLTADRILEGLVALDTARAQQKKDKAAIANLGSSLDTAPTTTNANTNEEQHDMLGSEAEKPPKGRGRKRGRGKGGQPGKNKMHTD